MHATTLFSLILEMLEPAIINAERVYRENKAGGSPAVSVAYDSGRVAGLKEALEIVLKAAQQ